MFDKMQCEEYYKEPVQLSLPLEFDDEVAADKERKDKDDIERMLFISENMLIEAQIKNGQLVRTIGTVVKAEQIELNYVKITFRDGRTVFLQLSENVRWVDMEV